MHLRFASTVDSLRAAGCVFAEDEAAILIETAAETAGDDCAPQLDELLARRVAGEPLEQIVGWVDFAGLRLSVQPGVFVPRQRTVLLAAHSVSAVRRVLDSRGDGAGTSADGAADRPIVFEAFCGIGPVASVVAASVPGVEIHLGDVQPEAVQCAVKNAQTCVQSGEFASVGTSVPAGEPGTTVTGHVLDCLSGLPDSSRQSISVIAAVPPYVPETAAEFLPREALDFEPGTALFGSHDGLHFTRRLITESLDWLAPDGVLLIELGHDQTSKATTFATEHGLEVQSHLGEDGHTVVLELRRRN